MGRCNCGAIEASVCQCSIDSADDCIVITGAGTAANPFLVGLTLDPSDDNDLTCGASGLLLEGPRGQLYYAQITSSVSLPGAGFDVTGLTAPISLTSDRRIEVHHFAPWYASTAAPEYWFVNVLEGANTLGGRRFKQTEASVATEGGSVFAIFTATAGSHTYKVRLDRTTGSGQGECGAQAGTPAFLAVKDLGPA